MSNGHKDGHFEQLAHPRGPLPALTGSVRPFRQASLKESTNASTISARRHPRST
jgi:hypothetical protein